MNNRFFSNGMQIYALFFTLQIFLNIFCKIFSIIFSKIFNTLIFKDLKNDDFLTFFEVFFETSEIHPQKNDPLFVYVFDKNVNIRPIISPHRRFFQNLILHLYIEEKTKPY